MGTTLLKNVINFLFYSNLWIASCAVAMTFQTQFLLDKKLTISPLIGLIFFSTLLIYAVHKVVGQERAQTFLDKEQYPEQKAGLYEDRFMVIGSYRHHIWFYAIIGFAGCLFCFFYLPQIVQWALIIPGALSLAYVLPFLGKNHDLRLRDLHFIKIFLIAIIWSAVTVGLPAVARFGINPFTWEASIWLMLAERGLFIFAITLPFDIRDFYLDKHNNVKTLPAILGIPGTLALAQFCLLIVLGLAAYNYGFTDFPASIFGGYLLSVLMVMIVVQFSPKQQHDYYFSGLMDGTMLIMFGCIWWLGS